MELRVMQLVNWMMSLVNQTMKLSLIFQKPHNQIAILAGEIIYQLRSALDHLAFDIVKKNHNVIALPIKWEENCMFPTWTNLKGNQKLPLPYGVFNNLPGIPKDVHTIIERVQPYYSVGVPNGWLKILAALSNIDKHRRFALTRTRARYEVNVILQSGIRNSAVISLDNGSELPIPAQRNEINGIVEMDRSISLFVAFDEKDSLGDATTLPIDYLLEQMLHSIVLDIYNPLKPYIS